MTSQNQLVTWRKSSHSGGNVENDCVEVAVAAGWVGVRDSKAPDAGALGVSRDAWGAFLDGVAERP